MAKLLGEIVVQLRHGALLDGLDLDLIGHGFPGQLRFRIIGGVDDLGLQFLAGFGAAQGGGESLHSVFAAHFDQRVFTGNRDRFRLIRDDALVGDLRPIAVCQAAVFFYRLDGGARIAQLLQFALVLLFSDFHRRLFYSDRLIALNGELRHKLEDRLYVQRLAVFDGQLGHARLADGLDAQVYDRLVEALRQQAVDHVLADAVGIAAPDDRFRHLAGAEAGDFGVFFVVAGHRPIGRGDLFGGNVQQQFAGAVRVKNRPMLVVVTFVIMTFVIMTLMIVG